MTILAVYRGKFCAIFEKRPDQPELQIMKYIEILCHIRLTLGIIGNNLYVGGFGKLLEIEIYRMMKKLYGKKTINKSDLQLYLFLFSDIFILHSQTYTQFTFPGMDGS